MCPSTFFEIRSRILQRTFFLKLSSPDAVGLGNKINLIGIMEILAGFSGALNPVVDITANHQSVYV
jgi:hypothetical protein